MMWGYDDNFGNANHGWYTAGMMLFWLLIITLAILLIIRVSDHRGGHMGRHPHYGPRDNADGNHPKPESPKDILDRRLASGEINISDHKETKKHLGL
jgi:uncharacterized membrane protein